MIMIPIILGIYDHGDIYSVARYNIFRQIYLFTIFIMFKVFIVDEILFHDEIVGIEDEKYILILEHVILLSGTPT